MATLTKEQILAKKELRHEQVQVPEWGGEVIVRELKANEGTEFESKYSPKPGEVPSAEQINQFKAGLIIYCCVDEDDKPMFNQNDVESLLSLSKNAIDTVAKVAMRLCGYGDQGEIKKNSALDESSSTGSRSQQAA